MQRAEKYIPFFTSAVLMCLVLFIIYPHYQYYIDPDGVAYLTIARRYATGDIQRAVNGYWSPWGCWLTAGFIRSGFEAVPAGVIVNTIGAIGFLFISQSFFLRFGVIRRFQWLLNITLTFFLCYAIFWQSFDDLWECFFLLSVLRIMLVDNFIGRPALWVLGGLFGSLAYFAKAYSFPFFILNTIACVYFLSRDSKQKWLIISFVMIGAMVLCSMPWIYALHNKYGGWITSTSGSLNMSWYLVGHPHWKEGIKILLPPVYPDSPYYWEDPWYANGATPHFWDSWHLLFLQLLRIGLNVWKFIVSSFQLSVFFIVVVGGVKWILFWSRGTVLTREVKVLMLSFLLFTLGYVLVNFESRYLWYMVPLSMLLGALSFQIYLLEKQNSLYSLVPLLFAVSFLVYPAWCMSRMYDEGANEFKISEQLKSMNMHGTFTCAAKPGVEVRRIERLAYFAGNQFYKPTNLDFSQSDLLQEMRRYHVNYLFVLRSSADQNVLDEQGKPFPEFVNEKIPGIRIFIVSKP